MASRDEIVSFLDELLESPGFPDYGPNGLQVPGGERVELVVTGVSAHLELFERAADAGAQLVLAHHGIFWGSGPGPVDRRLRRRLETLFEADISLVAYHLPLDAHPTVGNNALICAALGLELAGRVGSHEGRAVGFVGRSTEGIPLDDLRARCASAFGGREPLIQGDGPEVVRSVAVISGAAAGYMGDAVALGVDAFLTGEPAERSMADAREAGIHFIAAGHAATETFGVRRLGDLLAERFGVEHRFLEIPNPV